MFYAYLLLSKKGKIYIGQTRSLKNRLRHHNSKRWNRGYTRGDYWYMLAVRQFSTRSEAMKFEKHVKNNEQLKRRWLRHAASRARKLIERHDISIPGYVSIFSIVEREPPSEVKAN